MRCEYCEGNHDGSYGSGRFCCQACSRGFSTKSKRKKINQKVSKSLLGRAVGNGLILKLRGHKIKVCPNCKKEFSAATKCCSKECARLVKVKSGKNSKNGGYKERAGTRYGGWYRDIYCNSSWELAYILYCQYKEIDVVRNKEFFKYNFEGKDHKYYPDFIVNGEYVEVKGLTNPVDLVKWDQFPHRLKVMDRAKMKPVLELVKKVYGKDFMRFYERTNKVNIPS